jgi:hypothetical protein
MSVQQVIYDRLVNWQGLTDLLTNSIINSARPAVYDFWAPEDTEMPYVNMTLDLPGDNVDLYKVNGSLSIDIFVTDRDTLKAEEILREVRKALLSGDYSKSPRDGTIRIYPAPGGSGFVPEDKPEIVHYSASFDVIYWDAELIETITEGGH